MSAPRLADFGPATIPCRRFAGTLTGTDARLGADVVRYSFIAVDSHHLLLASLPRTPTVSGALLRVQGFHSWPVGCWADSSLEGNTEAFFSMIGVGDLVQQGVKDLVGSSVSMALARS